MLRLDHAPAWIAASLLLVALVVWGSLVPGPAAPPVDHFDKFQHAAVYGLLALWFTGLAARRHYVTVAAALIALGVLMEVLQQAMHLGPGRGFGFCPERVDTMVPHCSDRCPRT